LNKDPASVMISLDLLKSTHEEHQPNSTLGTSSLENAMGK
jgi:hypothetical protein